MNLTALGLELTRNRRRAGLTQREVAERMETKQSVIARVESGKARPSLDFLERFARATRTPILLELGKETSSKPGLAARRKRVEATLGGVVFDPWLRNPSKVEREALNARGLTREHFESKKTAS